MPIDVDKVLGAQLGSGVAEWDEDKVILYHVGVGAGVPPTDEKELEYTYEARLKVLPSFGVLPVFQTLGGLIGVEGLSDSRRRLFRSIVPRNDKDLPGENEVRIVNLLAVGLVD